MSVSAKVVAEWILTDAHSALRRRVDDEEDWLRMLALASSIAIPNERRASRLFRTIQIRIADGREVDRLCALIPTYSAADRRFAPVFRLIAHAANHGHHRAAAALLNVIAFDPLHLDPEHRAILDRLDWNVVCARLWTLPLVMLQRAHPTAAGFVALARKSRERLVPVIPPLLNALRGNGAARIAIEQALDVVGKDCPALSVILADWHARLLEPHE